MFRYDVVITQSYPATQQVQVVSLFKAIFTCASGRVPNKPPVLNKEKGASLKDVCRAYRSRFVAVFPEITPSNGNGILYPSPSIQGAPLNASIFPVSIKVSPPDITTPTGSSFIFLWRATSFFKHELRVKVAAEPERVDQGVEAITDSLARISRLKRLRLGAVEKEKFLSLWGKK